MWGILEMDKNKLLIISTVDLEKNGIATFILNYYRAFNKEEWIIDFVVPNIISFDISQEIKNNNGKVFILQMRKKKPMRYFWELLKVIIANHYSILHAHGNSGTLGIEMFSAYLGKCPIRISHSHNTTCDYKKAHIIFKPLLNIFCNVRFACSNEAGKWLFGNKKTYIIQNGIDLDKYLFDVRTRKNYREILQIEGDEILLGHVGGFNFQKNQKFLIDVLNVLDSKKTRKYKLLFLGDGELKKEVFDYANEKKVEKYIIFQGNVNNVEDYLQAFDIFLLPSRFEGLPFALVEAQAAGVPCIVSDVVVEEANITQNMKYIGIKQEDIKLWESAICEIQFMDRSKIDKKLFEIKGFSIEENAEKLSNIYKECIKKYCN